MNNATDYNLNAYASEIAVDIFAEHCLDRDAAQESVCQSVDGSEWVIYHHKAHELCLNCNTDQGEQAIDDMGGFPANSTYNSMASLIVYNEIEARVSDALNTLFKIAEEMEAA